MHQSSNVTACEVVRTCTTVHRHNSEQTLLRVPAEDTPAFLSTLVPCHCSFTAPYKSISTLHYNDTGTFKTAQIRQSINNTPLLLDVSADQPNSPTT